MYGSIFVIFHGCTDTQHHETTVPKQFLPNKVFWNYTKFATKGGKFDVWACDSQMAMFNYSLIKETNIVAIHALFCEKMSGKVLIHGGRGGEII